MSKTPAISEKGAEKELDKATGFDYDATANEASNSDESRIVRAAKDRTKIYLERLQQGVLLAVTFSAYVLILFFACIIIYVISIYFLGISDNIEKLEEVIIVLWKTLSGSAFFALIFTYILQKNKS